MRTAPRSPHHTAVWGRFHGTILRECWRPAFHRPVFTTVGQLWTEADTWMVGCHRRRKNHGDFIGDRTTVQLLATRRR